MEVWRKILAWLGLAGPAETRIYPLEQEVLRDLEALARRERRAPAELANSLLSQALWERQSGDVLERWYSLTRREQEVAALICLNLTSGQIAERLGVSNGTIKGYAHHILEKFEIYSREELRACLAHWDFSEWTQR